MNAKTSMTTRTVKVMGLETVSYQTSSALHVLVAMVSQRNKILTRKEIYGGEDEEKQSETCE